MKRWLFIGKIIICTVLLAGYSTASAQCNKGKIYVASDGKSEQVPHSVPFDGGATALLVAGTVYAIKRLYNKPKEPK